jgi:hypothetical protein
VEGIDLETGEEIAIQLQHIGNNMPILEREADIYNDLAGGSAYHTSAGMGWSANSMS